MEISDEEKASQPRKTSSQGRVGVLTTIRKGIKELISLMQQSWKGKVYDDTFEATKAACYVRAFFGFLCFFFINQMILSSHRS